MKKLLLIGMMVLLMAGVGHANGETFWLCEDDTIPKVMINAFKGNAFDMAYVESVQMFVYYSSLQTYFTSAKYDILDSISPGGDELYVLDTMIVANVDGNSANGWYNVFIRAYYTGGTDTSALTTFSIFKIGATSAGQELITDIINDNFDAEVTAMNTDVITATAIADNAITANEIATDAIGSAELAANAITSSELADNAITSAKIQDNAIAFAKLADGAIGAGKIGTDAITATTIESDAIGSAELAADAIGASEIAADAIGTSEIAAGAITTAEMATGSISADEVADDAIDAGAIAANALTTAEIATGAISADEIADNAIDVGAIAADAIASSELATTAVTEIVTAVYAADTATYNGTAGSYGAILANPAYVQGEAASITIPGIWSYVLGDAGDTLYDSPDSIGTAGYYNVYGGDTTMSFWVDLSDTMPDFDSTDYDWNVKYMIANWSAVSAGADTADIFDMLVAEGYLRKADSAAWAKAMWNNNNVPRASRDVNDIASFDGANEVIIGSINNDVIKTEAIKNGAMTPAKFDTSFYRVAADTLLRRTVTSPSGPIPPTSIATYIPNTNAYVNGDGVSGLDARVLEIQEDIGNPSDEAIPTRVAWVPDVNVSISGDSVTVIVDTTAMMNAMVNRGFLRRLIDAAGDTTFDTLYATLNATSNSADIESLLVYVGKNGISTPSVSLHMKLGDYDGTGGGTGNVKDHITAMSSGGGTGLYSVIVYIKSGSSYLTNTQIDITPIGGTPVYRLWTNTSGYSTFSLNSGTYLCRVQLNGYTQDVIPDTFVVSAAYQDTVLMTTLLSNHPLKARIYANVNAIVGRDVQGATLRVVPRVKGKSWKIGDAQVVLPKEYSAKSNANGLVYLDIFRSPMVTSGADTLRYDIEISKPNFFTYKVQNRLVPDTGGWAIQ